MKDKVFIWAEKCLNLPVGTVISVNIGTDEEGYSCCSNYASSGVWVTHSVPLTGRQRKPRTNDAFISLDWQSLDSLIEEILDTKE